GFIKIKPWRMKQGQLIRMFANIQTLLLVERDTRLAVGANLWLGAVIFMNTNTNLAGATHYNRATGQGMRMHRHQTNSIHTRMNNRTTARERISSGTRRCRHNKSIAMLTIDIVPVNFHLK